jgi:hypothetical protein
LYQKALKGLEFGEKSPIIAASWRADADLRRAWEEKARSLMTADEGVLDEVDAKNAAEMHKMLAIQHLNVNFCTH